MDTNDLNDDYFISSVSDESADSHLSAEGYIEETDHNSNNNNNNNNLHNNNNNVNNNAKNTNHQLHLHNGNNNDDSKYNSVDDYLARLWHVWSKQWKQTTKTTTTTRAPGTTLHTITTNTTTLSHLTYNNNNNNNNNDNSIASGPKVLALANNYEENVNIALIDSSETLLVGSNDDYATESMQRSMVRGINRVHKMIGKNATLKQIFDGGGVAVRVADDEDDESGIGNTKATSNTVHTVNNNYNNIARDKSENGGSGGSSFMLLFEDLGDYFYNYNGSMVSGTTTTSEAAAEAAAAAAAAINNTNFNDLYNRTNCTNINLANTTVGCYDFIAEDHNYWALILLLFPILTLFGNILVILSVCRERSLQTVTNYFIVSLAIADLLVAVVPMPFAVYVLVNGTWALPNFVCDFYIAMDVICSTSSIFNLVAISIDRYIAVTQPIKYAKHKNSRRVCLTILLVWAISAAIGSPIVLGLNNTPNRDPDLCVFYNTDFILYSSLSSFYIPTIIMVFLYYNIFKALNRRARKQRAARKPNLSELTGGIVNESLVQTKRLAETALDSGQGSRVLADEPATNTASGSNEEEDERAISPDNEVCHVIANDKSTEFMLATVVEETGHVVAQISSPPQLVVADSNGIADCSSPPDSPAPSGTLQRSSVSSDRRKPTPADSPPKREPTLSSAIKPLSFVRYGVQEVMTLARNDSTLSTTSRTSTRKDKKNSQASRFTIYKVHKASKKKREKSSARKERKATKTLAIVLGVFLFCWLPFFTCNVMDAMCAKFNKDCRPGVTAFILTTWLGYINSFVNPIIYTIFNPEFRKAFKKIMHLG